jgi:glucosyltransferase
MNDLISIVVPCYNESEALPKFIEVLDGIIAKMDYADFQVVLVNDGSRDKTLEVMKAIAQTRPYVKYVSFSRNFGKEAGMYADLHMRMGTTWRLWMQTCRTRRNF